jgi:hypothetical protein
MDAGDAATIVYSEQLQSSSFCSAWSSNSTTQTLNNATVTVSDSGANDSIAVTTPSCTFRLGTIIVGDYVSGGGATAATFTSSTLSWNPTTKTFTITLGTLASGSGNIRPGPVTAVTPKYTPVTNLLDMAGNAMAATQFTDPQTSRF